MSNPTVALVIPGRNCAATLDRCLQSVTPMLTSGSDPETATLEEIVFVDDGSIDETAKIAARYPVRVVQGRGEGPGAARNLGWQSSNAQLIWFIDSDCVAEPNALEKLLPHLQDEDVGGVGGSYGNLFPDNLLASLIHEEIVARHRRMRSNVNFLATFNVLYRREVLQQLGGFDESLKLAQDAEFAYRVVRKGHRLRFDIGSRVGHHHPRSWHRYLRTQCRQGFFRMMLYRNHPSMMSGDSYAGLIDYAQPPLACLSWGMFLVAFAWPLALIPAATSSLLLILLQWPVTRQCVRAMGLSGACFFVLGFVRAHARAVGMVAGTLGSIRDSGSSQTGSATSIEVDSSAPRGEKCVDTSCDVTSVSVIIPTRNRPSKVIKCLESLREQSVSGFEVVVINDGSTDTTEAELNRFSEQDLPFRLKVLHNHQPKGANPSRNLAIAEANGQWIAMLDDDCFADEEWLGEIVLTRDQFNAIAVTGHVENVASSNPWEKFFIGQQRVSSTIKDGKPIARRLVACNALVHRDWLSGTLDEDRATVTNDMGTSARGDEEGLRLAILRGGQCILHSEKALVYHNHPYHFRSFCKQALKSGRATARLALKYRLAPRWELVAFLTAPVAILFSYWSRPFLWVGLFAGSLFLIAVLYNELALKKRTVREVATTLPALFVYYGLRSIGYMTEFFTQVFFGFRSANRSTSAIAVTSRENS